MVVPNGGVQCRGPSGASLSSWRGPSNAIDQATGQGHHSLPFSPWVTEMTTLTRWVLLWLWRVRKLRHHILLLSLSEEFPSRSCEMRLLHLWPSGSSPLSFLPTRSHADICVPWLCEWCRTLIWSWINQLLMSNSCRKNTFPFSFLLLARFFCCGDQQINGCWTHFSTITMFMSACAACETCRWMRPSFSTLLCLLPRNDGDITTKPSPYFCLHDQSIVSLSFITWFTILIQVL